MLVLTRQAGERICVGDNVVITVLSSTKGKVRIGIEAPENLAVDREEVRAKKRFSPVEGHCSQTCLARIGGQ